MSRHLLRVVLFAAAVGAIACTSETTAPVTSLKAPASAAAIDDSTCRGGWTGSGGRC